MRTVTCASPRSAARTQRAICRSVGWLRERVACWTARRSRGGLRRAGFARAPGALFAVFIGVDDALHERVAHHVLGAEARERDASRFFQHFLGVDEAALLAAREIDLGHVAGDDAFAAEAHA